MEKRRLVKAVVVVVTLLCSVSFAGGPLGPPMSVLNPGQWAFDVAYFYEKMDLYGCGKFSEMGAEPNSEDPNLWDWGFSDAGLSKLKLSGFKTNAILGSIEYGLCENWDIYVRLGAADAKADIYWWGDPEKVSADFDYGLAWQIGANFTICQSGPWTFGGRMQIGAAYPGDWKEKWYDTWMEGEGNGNGNGDGEGVDVGRATAELDWWQGMAYLGATYQMSDVLQLYAGGGWQSLQGSLDVKISESNYYYSGEELIEYGRGKCSESYKLKHASAIGVFGVAWKPPIDDARVGVELIVGEAGKWGLGVTGAIPIP